MSPRSPEARRIYQHLSCLASDAGDRVEVPMATLCSAATTTVKVHLPGGAGLEVAPGTDPLWLAQLVRALAPVGA
jgi:hypothetical protein